MQKFRKPTGGDINYVAFAQAIDDQFTGHALHSPPVQKTAPDKYSMMYSVVSFIGITGPANQFILSTVMLMAY